MHGSGLRIQETAEALRGRYRPASITVLFVGESAPAGGTFFYAANSQAYREMRGVLAPVIGCTPDFLTAFMRAGFFLDDLCPSPVNWRTPAERRHLHRDNVADLAERIASYRPRAVVSFMKGIAPAVAEACRLADVDCPHHAVSFPGTGRQGDFRREIAAILPRLVDLATVRGG